MGATSDGARSVVLDRYGNGGGAPDGQLQYAPDAHAALEVALRESLGFRHERVGTEHLLLGMLRQSSSRAVTVLTCLRVDPDSVRERIMDLIGTPGFRSPENPIDVPVPVPPEEPPPDITTLAREVDELRAEVTRLRAIVDRFDHS
jgi:ATP-dependent Clp protease ATP-binding subunit ClpA